MQSATIAHIFSSVLLVTALTLHVVIIATQHWGKADWSDLDTNFNHSHSRLSPEEKESVLAIANACAKLSIGVWEACSTSTVEGKVHHICKSVGDVWYKDDAWPKAFSGFAILAVVLMAKLTFGSCVTLFIKSKGDRLRLLPYILFGYGIAAGVSTFIADIIFASNYKDIKIPGWNQLTPPVQQLLMDELTLGWGMYIDVLNGLICWLAGALLLASGYFHVDSSGLIV